ncbi:MAG: polysaccharide pyruvyl transferase family protein [Flavobacteriales bacterium]|nr:polysaccharide pyruvyl transferase family protein [Flavobacteriales bacterium]
MRLLYINDLRSLPNFGCRTTGAALEAMLRKKHQVVRRDGIETVLGSGWDMYAPGLIRMGGALPGRLYHKAWRERYKAPEKFDRVKRLDLAMGAKHDFITDDPEQSVQDFLSLARTDRSAAEMLSQLREADALVINGEGTLILSGPMKRDASYVLFAIALARSQGKKAYLLNAMVTKDPFSEPTAQVMSAATVMLGYCTRIACRESESLAFVRSLIGAANTVQIPDALFTWRERFSRAAEAMRSEPGLAVTFRSELEYDALDLRTPYICISGTSSGWRHGEQAVEQYAKLARATAAIGLRVYMVETCHGDGFLRHAARRAGVTLVPKETPVLAAGGLLAGAQLYITGRYHPAIMASSTGVPSIFMASNSHKTRTVQALLGYEDPMEFSACPSDTEIAAIVERARIILQDRAVHEERIRQSSAQQAALAAAYVDLLDQESNA